MHFSATAQEHLQWLEKGREAVVEPDLPIIDAHHHLWTGYGKPVPWQPDYWLADFAQDLFSGHNIVGTVFVECGYRYRTDGSAALKPVGETEAIDLFAREFDAAYGPRCKACAGIVGFADFRLDRKSVV